MAGATVYNATPQGTVKGPVWHTVYVKRYWYDEWEYVPYMDCLSCTEAAAPSVGHAMFRYNYGYILRKGNALWYQYDPIDLNGWYVCVYAHDYYGDVGLWIGVIDSCDVEPHGTSTHSQGTLTFPAYGIEHTLDRRVIIGSYTDIGYIDRTLKFNKRDRRGLVSFGNRSNSVDGNGAYYFSTNNNQWTNLQIINYLLSNFTDGLTYQVVGATATLDATIDEHDFHGKTVLQALNELIDHKRGLSWRIYTDGYNYIYIYVFSILQNALYVGTNYVPANEDQAVVDIRDAIDGRLKISMSDLNRYDSIIVRGNRISTCCTLSIADGTLSPGWTAEQETAYKAGSSAPDATKYDHDKERSTDKYNHVYQMFTVPSDWNFYAADGEGGALYNTVPYCWYDGTVDFDTEGSAWPTGLEFERILPIEAESPEFGGEMDYRDPFIILKATDAEDNEAYHFGDKLDALANHSNIAFRNVDGKLAIILRGRIPHLLALNHFDGAAESDIEPLYDYSDLIATVFFETDTYLQLIQTIPGNPISETGRTKLIEMRDAHYWWVVPGTVTDITDGALVKSAGGAVRDDSDLLRQTATLAAAWYGQQRATAELTIENINMMLPVGSLLIGTVEGWHLRDIGTVVTSRTWDLVNRKTIIQTGFRELDKRESEPGMRYLRKIDNMPTKPQKSSVPPQRRTGGAMSGINNVPLI